MSGLILFDEILFDPALVAAEAGEKFPVQGAPEFANTDIFNPMAGAHKINVPRPDEIRKIDLLIKLLNAQRSDYFNRFWLGGYGSAVGFRFRYTPDYKMTQEVIATNDPSSSQQINGSRTVFKLYKEARRPGVTERANVRRICKPVAQASKATGATLYEPDGVNARVVNTQFKVWFTVGGVDFEQTSGWTVNVTTGELTFTSAPASSVQAIKVTCEFDTPVAFVGNSVKQQFDVPSQVQGVVLREILPVELGIDY